MKINLVHRARQSFFFSKLSFRLNILAFRMFSRKSHPGFSGATRASSCLKGSLAVQVALLLGQASSLGASCLQLENLFSQDISNSH